MKTPLLILLVIQFVASASAFAQVTDSLTIPYTPDECASCAEWNEPQVPFQIHGNSYYVGTRGLGAVLITSDDGHVLIDGGLPDSAPLILENVRTLGFDPADIRLILLSHAHFDHAGGIAALLQASDARVAAVPGAASALEQGRSGRDDPQYGLLLDFPPVDDVDRFTAGDTMIVGSIAVATYATAGHTPGGTSFGWTSCENDRCLDIVYADSQTPISADDFRFSDNDTYPGVVDDFAHGHRVLESISCDILITTHPGSARLWERLEDGREGLVDPDACRRYAEMAREQLARRLERERNE